MKSLNNNSARSNLSANTRKTIRRADIATKPLPPRSMKSKATQEKVQALSEAVDDAFLLETIESLSENSRSERLNNFGGDICDSQGHSILRIGEQV